MIGVCPKCGKKMEALFNIFHCIHCINGGKKQQIKIAGVTFSFIKDHFDLGGYIILYDQAKEFITIIKNAITIERFGLHFDFSAFKTDKYFYIGQYIFNDLNIPEIIDFFKNNAL